VPIPDFQSLMLPLLELVSDGQDHLMKDVTRGLADRFELTQDERRQLLPSGQQTFISNRVAWAKAHMKMAGLLENPVRGYIGVSPLGRELLQKKLPKIDLRVLRQYPSYLEFVRKTPARDHSEDENHVDESKTPKEVIDAAYKTLRAALAKELLERVRASSPQFFEDVVVRLLVAMGYGGSLTDAGQRIGRSGDGGVDGIIKEDRLGLDVVCIQAKRWESAVGRPVVQAFVGSMEMYRARKGVLLTTSTVSSDALDYVNRIESKKVVLIDGETVSELMIDYNIGVSVAETYLVKKVDLDFFNEEGE
jgi:restriction system protein